MHNKIWANTNSRRMIAMIVRQLLLFMTEICGYCHYWWQWCVLSLFLNDFLIEEKNYCDILCLAETIKVNKGNCTFVSSARLFFVFKNVKNVHSPTMLNELSLLEIEVETIFVEMCVDNSNHVKGYINNKRPLWGKLWNIFRKTYSWNIIMTVMRVWAPTVIIWNDKMGWKSFNVFRNFIR